PMTLLERTMTTSFLAALERQMPVPGDFPACFAFSIHKAGSSLMHSMIAAACKQAHIPAISIPDILFLEGLLEKDWERDQGITHALTDGRVYIGFRAMPSLLKGAESPLHGRKSVLLVRDPRDAL